MIDRKNGDKPVTFEVTIGEGWAHRGVFRPRGLLGGHCEALHHSCGGGKLRALFSAYPSANTLHTTHVRGAHTPTR